MLNQNGILFVRLRLFSVSNTFKRFFFSFLHIIIVSLVVVGAIEVPVLLPRPSASSHIFVVKSLLYTTVYASMDPRMKPFKYIFFLSRNKYTTTTSLVPIFERLSRSHRRITQQIMEDLSNWKMEEKKRKSFS